MENIKKVFIVDDHPIIRNGLTLFLNNRANLQVCGEAEDANSAIAALNSTQPDIIIVDISLKGTNGIELIKAVRTRYKHIKILVLSMHDEEDYVERAIKAGAQGYVLKSDPEDVVITGINTILMDEMFLSESLKNKMITSLLGNEPRNIDNDLMFLTTREMEILELIGDGLNTNQIAKKLNLSPSTVGTHRERMKAKLNFNNSSELMAFAVQKKFTQKKID